MDPTLPRSAHPDGSPGSPCKQVSTHPELVEGNARKLVEGRLDSSHAISPRFSVGVAGAPEEQRRMEQQQARIFGMDPALVPSYQECKDAMKPYTQMDDPEKLVHAFAQHGDIGAFSTVDCHYHNPEGIGLGLTAQYSKDNELLAWCLDKKGYDRKDTVKILLDRSVSQMVTSDKWQQHIVDALFLQDDLAVQLLQAKKGIDVNQSCGWFTPLQVAASTGALKFATELLEEKKYGAQVDAVAEHCKTTPLELAVRWKQGLYSETAWNECKSAMLSLLLKHKADPNTTIDRRGYSAPYEYKESFIDWCVDKKETNCLVQLVKRNALSGNSIVKNSFSRDVPLLDWAVEQGSLPLVRAIIREVRSTMDSKPLRTAAQKGHKAVADYLAGNSFIEKRRSTGQCVMRAAVAHGWLDTADTIVQQHGSSIVLGVDDWYKKMALLQIASKRGDVRMVRQLLDWGADVTEKDDNGQLPIDAAVRANNPEVAGVLLAAGGTFDEDKTSPLIIALGSYETSPQLFEQILAYEPDRTHVREVCIQQMSKTPVEYAVDKGARMVKVMLEAGFDPNDWLEKSPFATAVEQNDTESIGLLLQHGADPEVLWEDDYGNYINALHRAACYGSVETISLLLDAGIECQKDSNDFTALLRAVASNTPEVVALLLDASDPQVVKEIAKTLESHNDGPAISQTLFEYAIQQNRTHTASVCQLLLDRGAELERVNELGETPVFWALRNSNAAALEWLVAQGAQLGVVNHEGQTPLSFLACQTECTQRELLTAVLKGLSASAGGLVSFAEAIGHSNQYRLNTCISEQQVAHWKQSMKFDPFAKIREYCGTGLHTEYDGKPTLAALLQGLEKKICEHGVYLFDQNMGRAFADNDIETVRQFIATGIDLSTYDVRHGATVLHWAAEHCHADLLTELLQKPGLKDVINKKTIHKCTALSEASNARCAQILLDNGAVITTNVVSQLIYKQKQEACSVILDRLNASCFSQEDIQSLHTNAARYGNALIAQKCMELGAEPTEDDLEYAVHEQHPEIVTLLRSKGVSVSSANKTAKERKWSSKQSFASIAVVKKNLGLLKAVLETADSELLLTAAYAGWHEGLAVLLDAGLRNHRAFSAAISAESLDCCKVLIEKGQVRVTKEHIKTAVYGSSEIMQFLLRQCPCDRKMLDDLLVQAIEKLNAGMVKVLLEQRARLTTKDAWNISQIRQRASLNSIAMRAQMFGGHECEDAEGMLSWHDRVAHIEWLSAWKKKWLEGYEMDVLYEAPNLEFQQMLSTLYALMTTPICGSAQEHKEMIGKFMSAMISGANQKFLPSPFEFAQKSGISTTFNDLFDPEKIEQWYCAIDREYAKKAQERN